jgi:hypothetical protein
MAELIICTLVMFFKQKIKKLQPLWSKVQHFIFYPLNLHSIMHNFVFSQKQIVYIFFCWFSTGSLLRLHNWPEFSFYFILFNPIYLFYEQ